MNFQLSIVQIVSQKTLFIQVRVHMMENCIDAKIARGSGIRIRNIVKGVVM
tara:strand:- start:334 stop:486 length:153 start_codon:yes stop_codon:yes gene_type:complete